MTGIYRTLLIIFLITLCVGGLDAIVIFWFWRVQVFKRNPERREKEQNFWTDAGDLNEEWREMSEEERDRLRGAPW